MGMQTKAKKGSGPAGGSRADHESSPGAAVPIPEHIYFYYLVDDGAGHFHLREYLLSHTTNSSLTQAEVVDLIQRASSGTLSGEISPPKLEWDWYSYIAFGMDSPTHAIRPGRGVTFHYKFWGFPLDDHNFSSGTDVINTFNPNISGVWFLNQRIRRGGGRLVLGDREKFKIRFPGLKRRFLARLGFFTHNESGTNIGP